MKEVDQIKYIRSMYSVSKQSNLPHSVYGIVINKFNSGFKCKVGTVKVNWFREHILYSFSHTKNILYRFW